MPDGRGCALAHSVRRRNQHRMRPRPEVGTTRRALGVPAFPLRANIAAACACSGCPRRNRRRPVDRPGPRRTPHRGCCITSVIDSLRRGLPRQRARDVLFGIRFTQRQIGVKHRLFVGGGDDLNMTGIVAADPCRSRRTRGASHFLRPVQGHRSAAAWDRATLRWRVPIL
jgi:hypothetical protein